MLMHGLLHIFSKKKVGKAVRKNIFVNKIVFFLVIFIFFMGGGGCAFPDSRDVISDTLFQNEKEDVTQSITIEDEIAEVPHVHKYNEDYVCTCGKVFYTEGLSYTFNEMGNYYIVDGIGTATGNELIIPKEYNGKPVEEIAIGAFKNLSHIKKLVIPSTIKRIGYDAFENMVHLTEIEYNAVSCEDCSSDGIFECAGLEGNGIELNIGEEVVRIPAYIFGANASPECFANIATVIFKGRNVIEVGVCAFGYCKNLASISLPEGTETIGSYAFAGCTGLKTLEIPSTVNIIGEYAFESTRGLTKIEYNAVDCGDCLSGVFEYAGRNGEGIELSIGEQVTRIPANMFNPNTNQEYFANIATVTFKGTNVIEIGMCAFMHCKSLESIKLPEGLETIGDYAFAGCAGAKMLVIPSTVKFMGKSAFENMTNVMKIEYNAINCEDLSWDESIFECAGQGGEGIELSIGEQVARIPAYIFSPNTGEEYYANIVTVTFKGINVIEIGMCAFMHCKSLESIALPEGLEIIGGFAFEGCKGVKTLVIPSTVKSIEHRAFCYMYGLEKIEYNAIECADSLVNGAFYDAGRDGEGIVLSIGEQVTRIPASMFDSVAITEVIFDGTSVKEIGESAFRYGINITNLTLPEGLEIIGEFAFEGCKGVKTLVIPSTVKTVGEGAFENMVGLIEIEYNAIECADCSERGTFYCAGQGGEGIELSIGGDVTRIPAHMFSSREYYECCIKTITFKGTDLKEIGENAFEYCINLTGIILPEGLELVYHNAFIYCKNLENITLPEGVRGIGNNAFLNCESLTSITLPEGVEVIGNGAFSGCTKMKTVVIPSTVRAIGENAFGSTYCLTEIEYNAIECMDGSDYYGAFRYAGRDGEGIKLSIGEDVIRIPAGIFSPSIVYGISANIATVVFKGTNVTEIGESAFACCENLVSIEIPTSVTKIKKRAFSECFSLVSVVFKEPYTWYAEGIEVEGLDDPTMAATYLKYNYENKELQRK